MAEKLKVRKPPPTLLLISNEPRSLLKTCNAMPEEPLFKSEWTHMLDARILSFRVGKEKGDYIPPDEVDGVSFRVESEEAFNVDRKQVRIILSIWIDAYTKPEEAEGEATQPEPTRYEDMGSCRLGFTFFLENFEELINPAEKEEDGLLVDSLTMAHLLAMAYSTSRGMILVKTRGTSLEGSLLPVIDPQQLMEKEMKEQSS